MDKNVDKDKIKVDEIKDEQAIKEELEKYDFDVATIEFKFNLTRDEARDILKSKHTKTSREIAKYFRAVAEAAARKFLQVPKGTEVKHDKVNVKNS